MTEQFSQAFERLRALMLAAAPDMKVARDEPGSLELRTPEIDPKTRQPGWFGTVTTKKTYVAVHLMPLYTQPGLADGISPELAKRRQGKTCFNFKHVDDALFCEMNALIEACARVRA